MLSIVFFFIYIFLFIGGMTVMRTGLMHLSGEKMKQWLLKFTSNPLKSFLFGIIITIILQSSSAVMIIIIGLISARVMSFPQSIGIILGTNIGTTATVEFLAYGTDEFIFPLLITGILFIFFRKSFIRSLGLCLFGLGAIFLAMFGFEKLAIPLAENQYLAKLFVQMNEHLMLSVLVGCIVTAIIQSSTAMTGIAMGFIHANILSLPAAIGIVLGANIGTCFDAYIASIGGGKEAKQTAYAHIWINFIGVFLFLPFLIPFSSIMEDLSFVPEQQLAHASVIFNVVVSLLFLPFTHFFAKMIQRVHK
ncbi:Na/Pi symporter [Bacillus kwashiorkori]|uniref:Na/Pi symporter n=1 Tax=Bacillus kwashiorkori TaxID=1522318 RepID=UPI000786058F|nr:Na/Pi symporter [Bacillus kwashiorkori]